MIKVHQTETCLIIRYRCIMLPMLTLLIPPGMLYEQGSQLLNATLSGGQMIGLLLGIIIPLVIIAYFVESAEFSFNRENHVFHWQRRDLFHHERGDVPLHHVIKVCRENLDTADLNGMRIQFRLQVLLEDGDSIALTRRYLSLDQRKLDQIILQSRDYLGHVTPMA